jgi:hypothetical protein
VVLAKNSFSKSEHSFRELYDHSGDDSTNMDKWENVNIAKANPKVAAQLRERLLTFFRAH